MESADTAENLTPQDCQLISEIDSRQFGFIKLNEPQHAKKKALVLRAIKYLEKLIIQANLANKLTSCADGKSIKVEPPCDISSDVISNSLLATATSTMQIDDPSTTLIDCGLANSLPVTEEEITIDPKTYCKLGHFHVLLEDFPKAMSAYQKYYNLRSEDYWRDPAFLYGLGLVYYFFHAYQWSTKSFQQVLYLDPGFCRCNEIHIRLGFIFKTTKEYDSAVKHFQLAYIDAAPCTFTKLEIKFHEAHSYELQNKYKQSKEIYESLLQEQELPSPLRADILRQLGWMFHTVDSFGEKNSREQAAVQYLLKSTEVDPKSGQSLYLLGRCYASLGKVHDAFLAYRNSVDKCEGNADTWCSIGILYQQQNQLLDALQAYICAVQFDKSHTAAWTNLGILYETDNQPRDALTCFMNACNGNKRLVNPHISARIKLLQQSLANAPMPSITNKPPQLLSIEEAWNLPVTADMSTTTNRPQNQTVAQRPGSQIPAAKYGQAYANAPPPYPSQGPESKRFKADNEPVRQQFYLNSSQIQMLQYLQQNQANLQPHQTQQLQQLQQNYRLMQQHQMQLRQQQQQQQIQSAGVQPNQLSPGVPPHSPGFAANQTVRSVAPYSQTVSNGVNRNYAGSQRLQSPSNNFSPSNPTLQSPNSFVSPQSTFSNPNVPTTSTSFSFNNNNGYSNNLNEALPKDLNDTVSDQELQELISQSKEFTAFFAEDLLNRLSQGENVIDELAKAGDLSQTALPNTQFSSSSPNTMAGAIVNQIIPQVKQEIVSPILKDLEQDKRNFSDLKLKLEKDFKSDAMSEPCYTIDMTSSDILEACKGRGSQARNMSMTCDKEAPPRVPDRPRVRLSKDQLLPPTASVLLENKKLAFSPQLQEFCLKHPIAVVRGMASALKLDLGLFSTKSLVEANPDHPIEIRTQFNQDSDKNVDPNTEEQCWPCASHRSHTTIAKYAAYQASSFQESLKEEQDRVASSAQQKQEDCRKKKIGKTIKFGTNVDLSDEKKWRPQLQELTKLPAFSRVVSAGNMLSHVSHSILGMNTVQLYMKVPGSRTPGHQENNNFCSINMNIGPGDCEWFAVPDDYWGAIAGLCEKNGTNYLHGSWWPNLQELLEEHIPVYRFLQKPGDMVWVNSGCVHWVQSVGWCNNIAWNVGPLTARQFQLGLERYEWNKLQSYKSIVPMIHLAWNLARNIKVSDQKFFELIRGCLMRSLRHVCIILDFVKQCGLQTKFHGRAKNEASHYCGACEVEVFHILFVKEQDKRHVVHCIDCARRQAPRLECFGVLEEYRLSDLFAVYDSFMLHPVPTSSPVLAPTPPLCSTPTPAFS